MAPAGTRRGARRSVAVRTCGSDSDPVNHVENVWFLFSNRWDASILVEVLVAGWIEKSCGSIMDLESSRSSTSEQTLFLDVYPRETRATSLKPKTQVTILRPSATMIRDSSLLFTYFFLKEKNFISTKTNCLFLYRQMNSLLDFH